VCESPHYERHDANYFSFEGDSSADTAITRGPSSVFATAAWIEFGSSNTDSTKTSSGSSSGQQAQIQDACLFIDSLRPKPPAG
jgi:hypothetical protein